MFFDFTTYKYLGKENQSDRMPGRTVTQPSMNNLDLIVERLKSFYDGRHFDDRVAAEYRRSNHSVDPEQMARNRDSAMSKAQSVLEKINEETKELNQEEKVEVCVRFLRYLLVEKRALDPKETRTITDGILQGLDVSQEVLMQADRFTFRNVR